MIICQFVLRSNSSRMIIPDVVCSYIHLHDQSNLDPMCGLHSGEQTVAVECYILCNGYEWVWIWVALFDVVARLNRLVLLLSSLFWDISKSTVVNILLVRNGLSCDGQLACSCSRRLLCFSVHRRAPSLCHCACHPPRTPRPHELRLAKSHRT